MQINRKFKTILRHQSSEQGSVLPMIMGLGSIMLLAGVVLILQSQQGQNLAQARTNNGNSLAIAEGGVARTLALLTKPNNAVLLTLNYDQINPNTGSTYLGTDAELNTGDEEDTAVDSWSNFSNSETASPCPTTINSGSPDITYTGTIGSNGKYKLVAYRYNVQEQTGTFLVEGQQGTANPAHIMVKVSINSSQINFPGVLAQQVNLNGRNVLGANGNIYYNQLNSNNSFLTGSAAPQDSNRAAFLEALWSGPTNNVTGTIFACSLLPNLPYKPPLKLKDIGEINDSRTISNETGGIEYYKVKKIDLQDNEIMTVDTTKGSVYIYINELITLQDHGTIRNVRSDGKPPQVGDLRLILGEKDIKEVFIYDQGCIDTAFVYNAKSDVYLFSTGDGCPSNGDSNIDGVVWAEDISNTTNDSTSGIIVPDDVSSLSDILNTVGLNMNTKNQLVSVQSWQRVKL
jgi:hypothetical protein